MILKKSTKSTNFIKSKPHTCKCGCKPHIGTSSLRRQSKCAGANPSGSEHKPRTRFQDAVKVLGYYSTYQGLAALNPDWVNSVHSQDPKGGLEPSLCTSARSEDSTEQHPSVKQDLQNERSRELLQSGKLLLTYKHNAELALKYINVQITMSELVDLAW